MALLAFNTTGTPLALVAGHPAPTLPASLDPGSRGPAFNVTSELRPDLSIDPANGKAGGLMAPEFILLQAQIDSGDVQMEWTSEPEYTTGVMVVDQPATTAFVGAAFKKIKISSLPSVPVDGITRFTGQITDANGVNVIQANTVWVDCKAVSALSLVVPASATGVGVAADAFTFATPTVTLTIAAGAFTSAMVGMPIEISGSTTPANDGIFTIISVPGATQVTYSNLSGHAEVFAGAYAVHCGTQVANDLMGNAVISTSLIGAFAFTLENADPTFAEVSHIRLTANGALPVMTSTLSI